MQLFRTHYPVTTLGWGVRAGIWVQGCSVRCKGCIARDTWEASVDGEVAEDRILEWLHSLPHIDGLTISGGEPLDQGGALVSLLRLVRQTWTESFDVLCYTGRTVDEARKVCPDVFDLVDALAVGPFEVDLPKSHPLLGSANQELLLLTELAEARYSDPEGLGGLQASVIGGDLVFVGVPGRGELEDMRRRAAKQGVLIQHRSWTV